MKYPGVKIYLEDNIPKEDVFAQNTSKWCEVNKKRWIYAADIFRFRKYLSPKILFNPPFRLVQAETICLECGLGVTIYAVEASGYVPIRGASSDVAAFLERVLKQGTDKLTGMDVYLTYVNEYPPEFLKLIRRHSFLFRKYTFDADNHYYANACMHCKSPIDDFLLFYEQDGVLCRCNPAPRRIVNELTYNNPIVLESQFA